MGRRCALEAYGIMLETDCAEGNTLPIPGLGYYAKLSLGSKTPKGILLMVSPNSPTEVPRAVFWVDEGGENNIQAFGPGVPFMRNIPIRLGGAQGTRARTNIYAEGSFDILTFTGAGYFTQAEYALRGWGGGLSLTSQILWSGWALRNGMFIPSRSCDAYPGADYTQIWQGMAETVEGFMEERGIAFASHTKGAEWKPPVVPQEQGWYPGVVTFSNLATGVFSIYGVDDGIKYRAYHVNIVEGGRSPNQMPVPMSAVQFRPAPAEAGRGRKIKSCKLV